MDLDRKRVTLDANERNIISLLQLEGRMSYVRMAEYLGVAEGTIRRKATRLIKEGIVKINALCNPYAIGYDAPAFIGINVERKCLADLATKLAEMPEVQFVAVTTGPYEIIIQVIAASNQDLFNFLMDIGKMEGIINTYTFIMLNIYKQTWNFKPIDKNQKNI